jgi:hypothetical protein
VTRRPHFKLPQTVCSLDIEASGRNPEKADLYIVGIKVYLRHGGRYYPCKYVHYLPDQLKDLEQLLESFDGVIIGHNIMGYDYPVLGRLISLKRIIGKSVDTLAFLYRKNGCRMGGLKLGDLCQTNFGYGKTLTGGVIPSLWNQGKHAEVISYNENDCKLTMRLWWHLVQQRPLRYGSQGKSVPVPGTNHRTPSSPARKALIAELLRLTGGFRRVDPEVIANAEDIAYLTGKKPQFTYRKWLENIQSNGHAFRIKSERPPHFEIIDPELKAGGKPVFYRYYCKPCEHRLFFVTDMHRIFSEQDSITCPGCGTNHPVLGGGGGGSRSFGNGNICVLTNYAGSLSFVVTEPPYDPKWWVEPRKARAFIRRMR